MCKICSGFGSILFKNFDVKIVVLDNGSFVMDGLGGKGDTIVIKFCPFCGRSLTKHAPDVVESAASSEISPASEVPASEAESKPATTQVM